MIIAKFKTPFERRIFTDPVSSGGLSVEVLPEDWEDNGSGLGMFVPTGDDDVNDTGLNDLPFRDMRVRGALYTMETDFSPNEVLLMDGKVYSIYSDKKYPWKHNTFITKLLIAEMRTGDG